jgi:hypothetical protein
MGLILGTDIMHLQTVTVMLSESVSNLSRLKWLERRRHHSLTDRAEIPYTENFTSMPITRLLHAAFQLPMFLKMRPAEHY